MLFTLSSFDFWLLPLSLISYWRPSGLPFSLCSGFGPSCWPLAPLSILASALLLAFGPSLFLAGSSATCFEVGLGTTPRRGQRPNCTVMTYSVNDGWEGVLESGVYNPDREGRRPSSRGNPEMGLRPAFSNPEADQETSGKSRRSRLARLPETRRYPFS